jgi:hypothetical protein
MTKRHLVLIALGGTVVIAMGYIFHSGVLVWVGAAVALGIPGAWASWSRLTSEAHLVSALENKIEGSARRSSETDERGD